MPADPHTLYLTADGLLEPVGESQVVRPVLGIAERGFRYAIASLERRSDIEDRSRVAALRGRLACHGVAWEFAAYGPTGSALGVVRNMLRLRRVAARLASRHSATLVHARGAVPALIASIFRPRPVLFDFRGYLIDERMDASKWFNNPLVLRLARLVERRLFASAAAAVSLTEIAAEDVRGGRFGNWDVSKPLVVIPTCADYSRFQIPRGSGAIPAEVAERLERRRVCGFVGSLNASYRARDAVRLFLCIRQRLPRAHLLCLTRQQAEMRQLLIAQSVPESAFTLRTARPEEIPAWLSRVEWGIHLLEQTPAKRASMPTKLAEFFAAGVRPIHYGCNDEVTGWVRKAGSGHVLAATSDAELARAADFVAGQETTTDLLDCAREQTRRHFDLSFGVERYAALLQALGAPVRVTSH